MVSTGESKQPGRRFVLFPSPFEENITTMLHLANLLHARGFFITILHTQFNPPDTINHPHFRFVCIPEGLTDQLVSSIDTIEFLEVLNTHCEMPFRDQMTRMLSDSLREPINCVIVDAFMYSAQAVVEQLGLPLLVLGATSATCFKFFIEFPLIWLEDSDREHPPDIIKIRQCVRRMGMQMAKRIRASTGGVIFNTFDAIEGIEIARIEEELCVPVFAVGPLHNFSPKTSGSLLAQQDPCCMEWLDKQSPKTVIYVSFGREACMDENELTETAWSLANSHQPFLWVLQEDSIRGEKKFELPKELEEEIKMRGKIVKWAPQKEVLAHPAVGAFWTSSGWSSIMESMCEGVPMLCRCGPCCGYQTDHARLCHAWNVGIPLKVGLVRAELETAIRRLMTDKEGYGMRVCAKTLKQNAAHCMKEWGSSYENLQRLLEYLASS